MMHENEADGKQGKQQSKGLIFWSFFQVIFTVVSLWLHFWTSITMEFIYFSRILQSTEQKGLNTDSTVLTWL